MHLLELPIEILTIIARTLDVESLLSLYMSCKFFMELIRTPGAIQRCNLTMTSLATAKTFKFAMFRDISSHLSTLNLCGVNDLHRSLLLPALHSIKHLKDLDVSFTKITMPDSLLIIEAAPALKSLAMNFSFVGDYKIDDNTLSEYQEAFKGLKRVNFFGGPRYLVDRKLAMYMLEKAELSVVMFTLCKHFSIVCGNLYFTEREDFIELKIAHLQIYYMREHFDSPLNKTRLFSAVDLKQYEIVMFQPCLKNKIYASPLLEGFIRKYFDEKVGELPSEARMVGEAAIMFWDKKRTLFDSEFCKHFFHMLKEYLIFSFNCMDGSPVPTNYNRYWVEQINPKKQGYNTVIHFVEKVAKRARLCDKFSNKPLVLQYDESFKEKKENFRLEICFAPLSKPMSVKPCRYLRMLNHLILNHDAQYTYTFFKTVFESCVSLVTLEIITSHGIPVENMEYISCSTSLKNVMLYVRGNLTQMYRYLSECRSLENIHLVDTYLTDRFGFLEPMPDPSAVFANCVRLYNFCYQAFMNERDRANALKQYKDARTKLKKYGLNIDMPRYSNSHTMYYYTPYISVFDAFLFKPIKK